MKTEETKGAEKYSERFANFIR